MPRKSAAANNIVSIANKVRSRITAPALLTKPERTLFNEAVRDNPHLKPADAALLASYIQALSKSYKLAKLNDAASIASWEKCSRIVIAMGRALRLTTHSKMQASTAARAHNNAAPMSYYQRAEMEGDE